MENNHKQIILDIYRNEQIKNDFVLTTPTARYRDINYDLSSFLESAISISDGGNTIISTKDYIELNKSNLEMKERIRKMEDLLSGMKINIERSTAVKLNFMTTDSIEYEYLCKLLNEKK